jgi:UDP-N-acetyl-alpha-D-quinovosamine dehydrogenase
LRVLVTGATGFVGHILCDVLAQAGYLVRAALRNDRSVPEGVTEKFVTGDIASTTNWGLALRDVDSVIHAAARAHFLHDSLANSRLYIETNADGTRRLAEEAAQAGVRRFVFLSSIKVNGEETTSKAYTLSDEPRPRDAYGTSKWLGERSLLEVAARSGMEASIVRSPLIYGPGVRANFLRLMRWVDKQRPLPLGAIKNRRSLVNVWNLCDLLTELLKNPAAAGTWMVSDGEDLSTPELIRLIALAMDRRVRLLPVPAGLLRFCGAVVGRKAEIARLCGSLVVDIAQTRNQLRWTPPVAIEDALARTVAWYFSEGRSRGS